jgi:ribonuclease P protein component
MERLRRRADFLLAAKFGSHAPAAAFVLQARRREDDGPARFGFTVSRKVGGAVERNRARRRLREMVRRADACGAASGYDYVVIARRAALTKPFDSMVSEFGAAMGRALKAKPASRRAGGANETLQRRGEGGSARARNE